jgi:hypothetical protein
MSAEAFSKLIVLITYLLYDHENTVRVIVTFLNNFPFIPLASSQRTVLKTAELTSALLNDGDLCKFTMKFSPTMQ